MEFDPTKTDTVSDLLEALGISEGKVGHMFIDGKYSKAIFTKEKLQGGSFKRKN